MMIATPCMDELLTSSRGKNRVASASLWWWMGCNNGTWLAKSVKPRRQRIFTNMISFRGTLFAVHGQQLEQHKVEQQQLSESSGQVQLAANRSIRTKQGFKNQDKIVTSLFEICVRGGIALQLVEQNLVSFFHDWCWTWLCSSLKGFS